MVRLSGPVLRVVFYRTATGREPVRQWLRSLDRDAKRTLGADILTVQFGWPLGMPLVRNLGGGLWEVRSRLEDGAGRVLFVVDRDVMVLVHGFIKKTQKTPKRDLDLARKRVAAMKTGGAE